MTDKSEKIILVTGGSKGIGRAIAIKLAESGYTVAITYNKSEKQAKELSNAYSNIHPFHVDVTDREQIRMMVKDIHEKIGTLSGIVNDAGIWHLFPFEKFEEEKYQQIMDTNLKGPVYVVLETLNDLKLNRGTIVNIASNAGVGTAAMNTTFYSVSKAALIMLTKRMALEFESYGIRANAVAPGWIKTDLTVGGKTGEEVKELEESFISRSTVKRTGKPEDVAELVAYLLSDVSEFMNGQVLVIDGGRKDNLTHSI
jgi:3-oxoacyl-[acyl-carrier protein] reductase